MNLERMENLSVIGFIVFVILAIAIIVTYPLVLIWSMNCLFPLLSIPYSFSTWLATVILNLGMFGSIRHRLSEISKKL